MWVSHRCDNIMTPSMRAPSRKKHTSIDRPISPRVRQLLDVTPNVPCCLNASRRRVRTIAQLVADFTHQPVPLVFLQCAMRAHASYSMQPTPLDSVRRSPRQNCAPVSNPADCKLLSGSGAIEGVSVEDRGAADSPMQTHACTQRDAAGSGLPSRRSVHDRILPPWCLLLDRRSQSAPSFACPDA